MIPEMMLKDWVLLFVLLGLILLVAMIIFYHIQDEIAWHEWNKDNEIEKHK